MDETIHDQTITGRKTDIAFIILAVVFLVSGLLAINELSIYTPDSARYLIWSNSLAHSEGYIDRTVPDPERYVIHAPLYSLVVAPIERIFPYSFIAAKVVTLFFGLLMLFFFYRFLSTLIHKSAALVGCVFLMVNPFIIIYSTEILSDIPFTACMILYFLLLEKILRNNATTWKLFTPLIVTIAACILLREVGISLLMTSVVIFILRKEYKRAFVILIVALLPYLLWLYRNEVIIAGIENPSFTNSRLFRSHFFSLPGDFFLNEYIARCRTNILVYAEMVSSLIFYPAYTSTQALLVSKSDSAVVFMRFVVEFGKYLLGPLTICCSLVGFISDIRQSPTGKARFWFLLLYAATILLYPINDRRFLTPLLILLIYYFLRACSIILTNYVSSDWFRGIRKFAVPFCVALLIVPNMVWSARYISNSYSYNRSPEKFYESQHAMADYPWHFTKLFRETGDWISLHTDSSSIFLAQWKDLACWTHGRKLYPVDQTIMPDEFDNVIQDYGIRYVIAMVNKNDIREFEFQMHQSRLHNFPLVVRIGNVEIYEIKPKDVFAGDIDDRTSFSRGLTFLNHQRYAEAVDTFKQILSQYPGSILPQFFVGVSEEFAGNLQQADSLFTLFRSYGQAGMFIQEASAHQRLIAILKSLQQDDNRAEKLLIVATTYWKLGFRTQAWAYIKLSLMADSTFVSSHTLEIEFALKEKDFHNAMQYYRRFKELAPDHPSIPILANLFACLDSLSIDSTASRRTTLMISIANDYITLGLTNEAMDILKTIVREKSNHIEALQLLGDLYLSKKRLSPARTIFEKILILQKDNNHAKSQMEQILLRF